MTAAINISNLVFSYPDGKQALYGIDLSVNEGEKVAFVGANGAGKSTLLNHLNGILLGDGHIEIMGLPLVKKNFKKNSSHGRFGVSKSG